VRQPAPLPAVGAAAAPVHAPPSDDGECPVRLSANFNHVLVAGNVGTAGFRVANQSPSPVERIEIYLSSRGLAGEALARVRRLAPGAQVDLLVEFEAARSGNFILQVAASWESGGQRCAFRGQRPLRIFKAPDNSNVVINIGDINSNTGGGANQGLGAEYGDVQISNLIERGAIKTLNDLLEVELPENFHPIALELDYELSQLSLAGRSTGGTHQITPAFLATAQPATLCQLDPVGGEPPPVPFRFVARASFRLGRGRADAEFIAWLLPRSTANDEKTRRVSRVQAVAEATGDGIRIRDDGSANGTLFDAVPLDQQGTALPRQGRLMLAGAVEVDFHRFAAAAEEPLKIANLRQWSGPDVPALPQRGAVRFEVIAPEPQPLNAIWVLSDAAIGTSRSAAVALADPALAELQGRLHHFRGCFWIETLVPNSAIQVDQVVLRPGDLVPLATGQQLRLGSRTWRVSLET
jgi:hypothetical protein